jgi:type VI secretion system secreted protein VgrG
MMQPHGGTTEGHHFPLRKGTEVAVSFQGGDPDRPVISGVVPNMHRPSTVTSKNHTQNVLRTGGSNHMVIEDLEGKQHIDLFSPTSNTNIFMGGPRRHAFTEPPTEKSSLSTTFASVDCSLYLFTEGSGGLDVGGSWWENVGANWWKYVVGTATIEYGGVHTLNVDGDSNEFYNAHQNVKVATGRTDTVAAGGMTQDITGGLTQTIKPGGSQTVTGGWLHKVTAQNQDKYGTWDTDSGAWTAHLASVAWNVDANIGFTSPTMTINCPSVTIKGAQVSTDSGFIKSFSPGSLETFGTKNAIGGQQFDGVAIVMGTWAAKMEAGGIGACALAVKTENHPFEAKNLGCAFKALGAQIWNAGVKVANRGTVICMDGFKKI